MHPQDGLPEQIKHTYLGALRALENRDYQDGGPPVLWMGLPDNLAGDNEITLDTLIEGIEWFTLEAEEFPDDYQGLVAATSQPAAAWTQAELTRQLAVFWRAPPGNL